jgi:hypothetical protein
MKKKTKRAKAVFEFRTLQRVCRERFISYDFPRGACSETLNKCIQNLCPFWKRLVKVR